MRLSTAHRILIGSAAAFFVFLTVERLTTYYQRGGTDALVTAVASLAAAVGFAVYLRRFRSAA